LLLLQQVDEEDDAVAEASIAVVVSGGQSERARDLVGAVVVTLFGSEQVGL